MTETPSPREVLTSIISTLSAYDPKDIISNNINPAATQRHHADHGSSNRPSNPLKLVPNSHRALLTTLHVLYPSTLLPALDLLDRRLVTRVSVVSAVHGDTLAGTGIQTGNDEDSGSTGFERQAQPERSFFLVRSAQQQQQHTAHRRRHHHHATTIDQVTLGTGTTAGSGSGKSTVAGGGKVYVVRLDAWNCSCAAFAFSAFPPEHHYSDSSRQSALASGSSAIGGSLLDKFRSGAVAQVVDDEGKEAATSEQEEDKDDSSTRERPRSKKSAYNIAAVDGTGADFGSTRRGEGGIGHKTHEFGGLSIDGAPDSGIANVPCCKHLLACVLGQRWSSVLGEYVEDRVVGREEAAGLMSDV
ncbi:coproporphyrinogen III oxidase [Microdochium nivale]|nr:coproporphyrinogen III oxidase [Microdochium nivale]